MPSFMVSVESQSAYNNPMQRTLCNKMKNTIKLAFLSILLVGVYSASPALGYRFLQSAVEIESTEIVKLLLNIGVSPYPDNRVKEWYFEATLQDHPLHFASKNGNYKMAQLLINHGAKVDACCCSCITPLHLAIIGKRKNIVKLLLKSGASTTLNYDTQYSAKELAQKFSTPEIMQLVELK